MMSPKYVVGLLNSRPLEFRFKFLGKRTGGGSQEFFANSLAELRLPEVDSSDERVLLVESLVDRISSLMRIRRGLFVPEEQVEINAQIVELKLELDSVAMDLYRLSSQDLEE